MSMIPTLLPVLSAGAHRRPQDGGCFMEIASLLAGERWSDHPSCTHNVLGAVARCVNDSVSDAGRQRLATLVPAVIGAQGADPRLAPALVQLCVRAARESAADSRRLALDADLREAERRLAAIARAAAEADPAVPAARSWWSAAWVARRRRQDRLYRRLDAPLAIRRAVTAISEQPTAEADRRLRDMLLACIELCRQLTGADARTLDPVDWSAASRVVNAPR